MGFLGDCSPGRAQNRSEVVLSPATKQRSFSKFLSGKLSPVRVRSRLNIASPTDPKPTSGITVTANSRLAFDAVITSKDGLEKLLEFAKSEHSDENIAFYKEIQQYKLASSASRDDIGRAIVDTYLCASAEQLVNLPSDILRSFNAASCERSYVYTPSLFDAAEHEMFRLIQKDTFGRFTLSDYASELIKLHPELAEQDKSSTHHAGDDASHGAARATLQQEVKRWKELVDCDRITLWVINKRRDKLFNVASTQLGNSVIGIPMSVGLVGRAARVGGAFLVDDAYDSKSFDQTVDKATGYRTRAVCSVALRETNGRVVAVTQLINKFDKDGGTTGLFTASDARAIEDCAKAKNFEDALSVFLDKSEFLAA